MSARICPQCGAPALEGSQFCASCGTQLGPPAAPAGAVPQPVQAPPQSGPPMAWGPEVPPKEARRTRSVRGCLLVVILVVLTGGVGGGALLISAGALERLKPLESVTFGRLDEYATGRHVTLTGGLSLSDPITCYDNGTRCPIELFDAADTTVGSGHPRTMFITWIARLSRPALRCT